MATVCASAAVAAKLLCRRQGNYRSVTMWIISPVAIERRFDIASTEQTHFHQIKNYNELKIRKTEIYGILDSWHTIFASSNYYESQRHAMTATEVDCFFGK